MDDLAANCEGARAAGWQAVHFRDAEQAVTEVHFAIEGANSRMVTA